MPSRQSPRSSASRKGRKAATTKKPRGKTSDPRQLALPLPEESKKAKTAANPAPRRRGPLPRRPIPADPARAVAMAEHAAQARSEDPDVALDVEAQDAPAHELLSEEALAAIIRDSEKMISAAPAGASSSFAMYLHEMQKYPVLTPDQEVQFARHARLGSADAKDALVRHNLRFVITIARKHAAHGVAIEDLVQEGNIGLMRAVQKFNETRGVRFVSYAVWWIQQSVRAALASQQRAVRLPINRATQLARINRTQNELTRRLGRAPTHPELAAACGVPTAMIQTLLNVAQTELSLDAPHPGEPDGAGVALGERIGSDESVEATVERRARAADIAAVLRTLRPRDEQILRFCFGLEGGREYTLEEIGLVLNITRERVRQIRDRALKELRSKGHAEVLRDYWKDGLVDE